jgi:glycosyltransferase involved in cell wall biosynthesis
MTRLEYAAGRWELIVVDDGGPHALDGIVDPFRAALPVTLIHREHAGPGAARNAGAARARGRYVLFTADDCRPATDWLMAIERRLLAHPDAMIGGSVANGTPENFCATTTHLLIDYLYRCHDRRVWNAPFFTPNNLAMPIALFHRIGGFDESMGGTGEDREICGRWLASGLPMVWAPEALVHHVHPQSLAGFWRQHVSYGRGSRRFYDRRPGTGDVRPTGWMPESPAFYWNLVCHPLGRAPRLRAPLHSALIVVSQVANALGFVLEGRRARRAAGNAR